MPTQTGAPFTGVRVLERAKSMPFKVIDKKDMPSLVTSIMEERGVIGPVAKDGKFVFSPIGDYSQLRLDYNITLLPPKEFFLPTEEPILRYRLGEAMHSEPVIEAKPRVIMGVHPCDINANWLLDLAFSTDNLDTNYMEKRKKAIIVGLDCNEPCDEHSFCKSMGSLAVESGYDLFLTDIGDAYMVEYGTPAGMELLGRHKGAREATNGDMSRFRAVQDAKWPKFTYKLEMNISDLPNLLAISYDNPLWEELGKKCLACGACTLVCPTCYCFDVIDRLELNLKEGQRLRIWDSCQLPGFATVAGGENFRHARADRQRHRFFRKGKYLTEMFGKVGCVGCGRCVRSCLVDIDPVEVYNTLKRTSTPRGWGEREVAVYQQGS
jgi:sulfhydrogenase subunit beta (sulfur reductase)